MRAVRTHERLCKFVGIAGMQVYPGGRRVNRAGLSRSTPGGRGMNQPEPDRTVEVIVTGRAELAGLDRDAHGPPLGSVRQETPGRAPTAPPGG